jgi:hypothetical protein
MLPRASLPRAERLVFNRNAASLSLAPSLFSLLSLLSLSISLSRSTETAASRVLVTRTNPARFSHRPCSNTHASVSVNRGTGLCGGCAEIQIPKPQTLNQAETAGAPSWGGSDPSLPG